MPREGRVNLHTGDGSIRLANFKGEMDLQTGDGHQDIDSVDGTLRARAGDGHITAAGRFDVLELTTGDGRIEARALSGSADHVKLDPAHRGRKRDLANCPLISPPMSICIPAMGTLRPTFQWRSKDVSATKTFMERSMAAGT